MSDHEQGFLVQEWVQPIHKMNLCKDSLVMAAIPDSEVGDASPLKLPSQQYVGKCYTTESPKPQSLAILLGLSHSPFILSQIPTISRQKISSEAVLSVQRMILYPMPSDGLTQLFHI